MRPLSRFFGLVLLAVSLAFASCKHEVCSGLNPEVGKYNTTKRLGKGGRSLKSKPEKDALKRRRQRLKNRDKDRFSAKGRYGGGFHIFGKKEGSHSKK